MDQHFHGKFKMGFKICSPVLQTSCCTFYVIIYYIYDTVLHFK